MYEIGARHEKSLLDFDDHPLIAIWEMTQACDLVCRHCRACATPHRDAEELTTEEAKKLLESIKAMGTPLCVLTGGDPAKRPDLVENVAHGREIGLTMALTPSGTPLMTRELIGRLKDAGLTEKGRQLAEPIRTALQDIRYRALDDVSPEEIEITNAVLLRMIANLADLQPD